MGGGGQKAVRTAPGSTQGELLEGIGESRARQAGEPARARKWGKGRRQVSPLRTLAGSRACLARLSLIPSSSSPWVLPGALLTAFWPPPPHPWLAAALASLYMYKLPINRTAAIMFSQPMPLTLMQFQ